MPLKAVLATIIKPLHARHDLRSGPRRRLEDLPFELLEQIFYLACTDGGRTGCSLSLVSKHIRAASISTRFLSVALQVSGNTYQLDNFLESFGSACIRASVQRAPRPRVHHMCLWLARTPKEASLNARFGKRRWSRYGVEPLSTEAQESTEARQRLSRAISKLFQQVGTASFRSLAVLGCEHGEQQLVFDSLEGFPNLRELAITGFSKSPIACAAQRTRLPDRTPLYPVLERLLIAPSYNAEVDFAWLAANAPRLKQIRVMVEQHVQEEIKFLPNLISVLCEWPPGFCLVSAWNKLTHLPLSRRP